MKPETIKTSFCRTGIHPFNSDIFDATKFSPAHPTSVVFHCPPSYPINPLNHKVDTLLDPVDIPTTGEDEELNHESVEDLVGNSEGEPTSRNLQHVASNVFVVDVTATRSATKDRREEEKHAMISSSSG
ncbi:hypothetical protein FRC02_011033 [Tulasnella sp. 418]|nr:hypothetical protein FRC02_011033 [Tulasnella sp. 418]